MGSSSAPFTAALGELADAENRMIAVLVAAVRTDIGWPRLKAGLESRIGPARTRVLGNAITTILHIQEAAAQAGLGDPEIDWSGRSVKGLPQITLRVPNPDAVPVLARAAAVFAIALAEHELELDDPWAERALRHSSHEPVQILQRPAARRGR